jgi:hypothetical protein
MVRIKRATREGRERDKKRGRYLLILGHTMFHISKKELRQLVLAGLQQLYGRHFVLKLK